MSDDDVGEDIPHLRQIDKPTVRLLCDRALAIAGGSHSIKLETGAFRMSRSPWDATRLANALQHHEKSAPITELVADLDAAAEDCAGLVPSNRHPTRL